MSRCLGLHCAAWCFLHLVLPAIAAGAALAAPTPHWQEFGLLQRPGGVFYDAGEDRLISLGGERSDAYVLPLETGDWQWLSGPSTEPGVDWPLGSMVWDPDLRKVHFAGGSYGQIQISTLDPVTGAVEHIVAPTPAPLEHGGALRHDPANARFWLWGRPAAGPAGQYDLWVLDLQPTPAWSPWPVDGPRPTAGAFGATIVLDAERHRMLIFEGAVYGSGPGTGVGVWALDLDTPSDRWTLVAPGLSEPWGAGANTALLDEARDRVLVLSSTGALYAFSLEQDAWSLLAPASSTVAQAGAAPVPRIGAGLTIDTRRDALVLVSGSDPANFEESFNDVWSFALDGGSGWSPRIPPAQRPPVREAASDGHDAARRRLLLFGGRNPFDQRLNDVWCLDLAAAPAWSAMGTAGTSPPGRSNHSSVFDAVRDQLLVYGGSNAPFQVLGDVWALSFAAPTPAWSPITPSGTPPPARSGSCFVYDSLRDRFLVLFGAGATSALNDVWELRLAPTPAWRRLSPAGVSPSARAGAMAAYDAAFDRVIVFGGYAQDQYLDQLWALNLATGDGVWQALSSTPGPSGRTGGLLRADPEGGRLLLFGGHGIESVEPPVTYVGDLGDAWQLALTATPAWTPIAPAPGPRPAGRNRASGGYDPVFDRLIVTCGNLGNDTWALNFGDAPTSVQLALHDVDVTSERVRLSWAGGAPGATATVERREAGDAWRAAATVVADHEGRLAFEDRDVRSGMELEYRLVVAIDGESRVFGAAHVRIPHATLALATPHPGRATFRIQLPSDGPATLELFDVTGRRVWSRAVGTLGAGTHEVAPPEAALAPALYFARLTQGPEARRARVVVWR